MRLVLVDATSSSMPDFHKDIEQVWGVGETEPLEFFTKGGG